MFDIIQNVEFPTWNMKRKGAHWYQAWLLLQGGILSTGPGRLDTGTDLISPCSLVS